MCRTEHYIGHPNAMSNQGGTTPTTPTFTSAPTDFIHGVSPHDTTYEDGGNDSAEGDSDNDSSIGKKLYVQHTQLEQVLVTCITVFPCSNVAQNAAKLGRRLREFRRSSEYWRGTSTTDCTYVHVG